MIGVSAFVNRVEEIAARKPTYRTGGVGKDGTCDCIGLVMGAMYELGHKAYDLHSTNYFSRYQTMEMKKVNKKELFIGQLLYRSRRNQGKLHARYLPGGRYYTGDLLDYYHVAVVTSVKPLRIIECTEYGNVTGVVISETLGRWNWGGKLRGVEYGRYEEGAGKEVEAMIGTEITGDALYRATVATKEGALNVRKQPEKGMILGRVPRGKEVDVLSETGEGWKKIRYGELVGYVSEQYLMRNEEGIALPPTTTLISGEGMVVVLHGSWRVAQD